MRGLSKYILEENVTELKQRIIDQIQNTNDSNEKTLLKISSFLETTDESLYETLDKFLDERGLSYCKKEISQILINNCSLKKFVDIVINDKKIFEIKLKSRKYSGNIITEMWKFYNEEFPRKLFSNLAFFKKGIGNKSIGKFEILLKLFCKNINKNSRGDVLFTVNNKDNSGVILEIKSGNAAIKGNNTWKNIQGNVENFKKYIKSEKKHELGLEKFEKIINHSCLITNKKTYNEIKELFAGNDQIIRHYVRTLFGQGYLNYDEFLSDSFWKQWSPEMIECLSKPQYSEKDFQFLCGLYNVHYYHFREKENFKHSNMKISDLIIMLTYNCPEENKNDFGKYVLLSSSKLNSFSLLSNFINRHEIKFTKYIQNSNEGMNQCVQFNYQSSEM